MGPGKHLAFDLIYLNCTVPTLHLFELHCSSDLMSVCPTAQFDCLTTNTKSQQLHKQALPRLAIDCNSVLDVPKNDKHRPIEKPRDFSQQLRYTKRVSVLSQTYLVLYISTLLLPAVFAICHCVE